MDTIGAKVFDAQSRDIFGKAKQHQTDVRILCGDVLVVCISCRTWNICATDLSFLSELPCKQPCALYVVLGISFGSVWCERIYHLFVEIRILRTFQDEDDEILAEIP
jgi:hypothetical protein